MLAAMTHPSRVLNLDMKAKLCNAKELYLIYIYISQPGGQPRLNFRPPRLPHLILTYNLKQILLNWKNNPQLSKIDFFQEIPY